MKRKIPSVPPLALLALLLPLPAMADAPPVALTTVERAPVIEEVRLNGTVTALRSSRISAAVAGLVDEVRVDAGDRVDEGDRLVGLDAEPAEADASAARAAAREGEAALAEARRRYEEAASMDAGENIPTTEVRARESAVAVAEAELARLRAERERAEVALRRHRVTAPFAGVIHTRNVDLGEWVTPGNELLRLVDTDNLRIDFAVPQDYYRRLDEGAELELLLPDGRTLAATIATRVPVTDSAARTFRLRARPPEAFVALPGMGVEGRLRLDTGEQAPAVPRDALNRYPDGRVTVWVAEPSEGEEDRYKVTERRLELGAAFGDRVAVRSGLEGGERVVHRGNEALEADMTVRVADEATKDGDD
ncbi:MAG: efflux RND transporter periplasmic adaptor subunit [Pseudomonadota bacterium]